MTFSTRNFDPLTPLATKFPNFAIQILLFRLKHTVAVVTHAHVLQHHLDMGCCLKKQRLWPKLEGGWARAASKKIETPYVFLQPLKLVTSNLVHKLGLVLAYQKWRLGPKLAGVWARGASKKSGTPTYFCNRWSWQLSPNKQRLGPKLAGSGPGEHPKKIGTAYLFLQPLKLATEKLAHNMSSGLPCQIHVLGPN